MTNLKSSILILNLSGELSSALHAYFDKRKIQLVSPVDAIEDMELTHILVSGIENFDALNEIYDLTRKSRSIISLSDISDIQNFAINNGNFIFKESWLESSMGLLIIDKYFQSYGGISFEESYPSFKELGSFNVTNPFNTGEYLDRMVHSAFENGMDALILKTYFDHLLMHLTGLKKKGLLGLPLEVTYGVFEENYAVQVHFYADKLNIFDLATSFSPLSKKLEDHLLFIALQSTDFFDLSYMPEVNKVVITGLWKKGNKTTIGNDGLMFSTIRGSSPFAQYEGNDVSSVLVAGELSDLTDEIIFPASVDDISDEEVLINDEPKLDDFVQTIRGKFDEDKETIRITGKKLDVDRFAYRIAANVDETTKEKNLKVRSLESRLPEAIKTGLFDFAKLLNKSTEDLDDLDLVEFQIKRMPEIIRNELMEVQVTTTAKSPGTLKEIGERKQEDFEKASLLSENQKLKSQLKTLSAEVRILKDSRQKMAELHMKASLGGPELSPQIVDSDESLRQHFQDQISNQKSLNEHELKKLSSLLERESKFIAEAKVKELNVRKVEIEALQKETYFSQEIEKNIRNAKAKDLILVKTKETFNKILEKKEKEIEELKSKTEQLTKILVAGPSSNLNAQLKDLEKQNHNLLKQIDVYKIKFSSLTSNFQSARPEDNFKEESRKLQMLNQQLQNMLSNSKKDAERWQMKSQHETTQLHALRQEKMKLEQLLKRAQIESAKESITVNNGVNEQELKRSLTQNQILEAQLRDAGLKINHLEARLSESMRLQKGPVSSDDSSKVKLNQLENSVRKLTQDLVESRNLVAENKRDTNKLRQEKTALQNQLDKLKKETEKAKAALPKKNNGRAA